MPMLYVGYTACKVLPVFFVGYIPWHGVDSVICRLHIFTMCCQCFFVGYTYWQDIASVFVGFTHLQCVASFFCRVHTLTWCWQCFCSLHILTMCCQCFCRLHTLTCCCQSILYVTYIDNVLPVFLCRVHYLSNCY